MAQGLGSDKPDYREFSGYEWEKDGESGPESPELKAPLTQYKAKPRSCFIFSFRTKQKGISNVTAKGRKLSKSTTGRIRQPSKSLPSRLAPRVGVRESQHSRERTEELGCGWRRQGYKMIS